MNQMEAFKWEQKHQQAVKEKTDAAALDRADIRREEDRLKREEAQKQRDQAKEVELGELEKLVQQQARRVEQDLPQLMAKAGVLTHSPEAGPSERIVTSTTTMTEHNDFNATVTSSRARVDSSESIYAFIIRRLNALEGNSSLVARYIEEQNRVMRQMLGRIEHDWDEFKQDWEVEEQTRWQQEVSACCRLV